MGTVVLLDSNYMAHRSFHATPLITSYGKMTNITYGYLNSVLMVSHRLEPAAIVAVWDKPGAKSWRRELFPGYKATRVSKAGDSDFTTQVAELKKEILPALGIPVVESDITEADDVIGYLATKYAKAGHDVVIFSNDGDYFQLLVYDNVKVYHPDRGYMRPEDHDEYGVPPNLIVSFKAIVGDSSDEYPGVSRLGKQTAKRFFQKNKGLGGIFDGTANFSTITPTMAQRLILSKDEIYLYKRLAMIDTVKGAVPDPVFPKKNMAEFRAKCEELEFNSFLEKRWSEFVALPECPDV